MSIRSIGIWQVIVLLALLGAAAYLLRAQTRVNLATQSANNPFLVGPFASMKLPCVPGTLYFATDQPDGQWISGCNANAAWVQLVNIGGSGALKIVGGTLDVNQAIVPLLYSWNRFSGGVSFLATQPPPTCTADIEGTIWIKKGSSIVEWCLATGTNTYGWMMPALGPAP
jgi:hypothetical protein